MKGPSEPQARVLGKLFGGSKGFNPKARCVADDAHEKKKKFEPKTKDSQVTIVMLKKYESRIPRGEYRQELSDSNRVQKIKMNRNDTPKEVKNKILAAFGCKGFSVLECANGGYLLRAADEELTSQLAIDRRGALYLCEKPNSASVSKSSVMSTKEAKSTGVNSSSASAVASPLIETPGVGKSPVLGSSGKPGGSKRQKTTVVTQVSLIEWL